MSASAHDGCLRGVVGVLERDGAFLMIKRSEQVRAPGKWCFPGGAIEPGEAAPQTIVREFREELGLVVEARRKLWSWRREDGGLYLEWWEVCRLGGELRLKTDEVAAVKWMTEEDMRNQADMIPNNLTFLEHYRALQS